jgi:hypothetical protein
VADAMILERRGVPSVFICAEGFTNAAKAMARRESVPDLHYIVVPQPFSSLSRVEVRQRATEVLPEVLSILGIEEIEAVASPGS